MAFEFRLDSVHRHRKLLENEAQREFILVQRALDDCLAEIKDLYLSIDKTREQILEFQKLGDFLAISEIQAREPFIEGQKVRIFRARQRARELMAIVEAKHELLIAASREYKKLDKLKDKRKLEYRKEQRRLEAKQMDDLVTMRAGRGEKE